MLVNPTGAQYDKATTWFCCLCRQTFDDNICNCGVRPIRVDKSSIQRDASGRIVDVQASINLGRMK